jgi:hypothetical protein
VKVLQGGAEGVSDVEVLIGPGDWYLIALLKDGKQVGVRHETVSKDGKTMRSTVTGTLPDGKPFEQAEVYDRQ